MKKSPGTKAQRAAVVIVSIRHLTKSIGQWQRHIHGGSTRTCELPCSSKELVEGAGGFLVLYTILLPCATFYFTFHISTYSSRILDSRRLDLLCGGVGVKKSSSLSLTQNPNVKKAEFCSILVLVHCINGLQHHTTTKWGGEEKIFLVRMKEPEVFRLISPNLTLRSTTRLTEWKEKKINQKWGHKRKFYYYKMESHSCMKFCLRYEWNQEEKQQY